MESKNEVELVVEDAPGPQPQESSFVAACRFAVPAALAALLAGWLGPSAFEAVGTFAINGDAGFYVSKARLVAEGLVPYRDFGSGYSPAAYYMLAALGTENLAAPVAVQRAIALLDLCNAGLLGLLVFRLCRQVGLAVLVPAVYLSALLRFEGLAVVLEPFQVIFLLVALLILTLRPRRSTWVAAGIAAGASLMAKQYGMLWLPALGLACAWKDLPLQASTRLSLKQFEFRGPLYFFLGLPVPFLLFVLLTQQPPIEIFVHLATFGGRAEGYAQGAGGGAGAALTFLSSRTGIALIGSLLLGAVGLFMRPTVATGVCVTGCLFSLFALCVRTYFHYAQLVLPWALLLSVCAASSLRGSRFGSSAVTASCVLGLCLFGGVIQESSKFTRSKIQRDDQSAQMRLSKELMRAIPEHDDVLVTSFVWLYATTDFPAPRHLNGWQISAANTKLAEVGYAIAPPHRHLASSEVHEVLLAAGLRKWKTVEVADWPAIQLYRRSQGSSRAAEQ